MSATYTKIARVLEIAGRPLAAHDFREIPSVGMGHPSDGLSFVGITEATLARRLREMRRAGLVLASKVEGKAFVAYSLVPKPEPAAT